MFTVSTTFGSKTVVLIFNLSLISIFVAEKMFMKSFCLLLAGVGASDVRYNHSILSVCLLKHRSPFQNVHWNN